MKRQIAIEIIFDEDKIREIAEKIIDRRISKIAHKILKDKHIEEQLKQTRG
jgi:hypothetical protein